ncbi:MAG: purine-nucleoside phosphorylase [Ignavibacteria bacterium]|nr:purine-nucleoside phosphorylase [Ignavibacteria bacterium]
MTVLENQFSEAIAFIKQTMPYKPDMALILGSGLGDFADSLHPDLSIPTTEIPGYPASTVAGHSGKLHFVQYHGKKLMIFQGRIHYYEGYTLRQCLLPVELAFQAGAASIIITNAAGGINSNFSPGDLMLTTGFNSMFLKKDLATLLSPGTPDRRNALLELRETHLFKNVKEAALSTLTDLKEGVYFYTKGPNYETPAEVRFIRGTGADAVGMSSVHEGVYAVHLGMDIAVISCISNFAAGISTTKLHHGEVTETANRVKTTFEALLKKSIELA